MIKKICSLKNRANSKYLVSVSVRDGGVIRQVKKVVDVPKWRAEELEAELKKQLKKEAGLQREVETFSDVLDYYEKQHLVFKKSYKKNLTYINRLRNDLGNVSITDFTVERLRKYLREDIKGINKSSLKDATLNRLLSFSKAAFQFSAENKKIAENPLKYTKKLRLREYGRNRTLSDDEWIRLQGHLPDWLKPIVTYAYLVPTRAGELKSLRKEWIKDNCIWLPGQNTKTGKPRYLPIPPSMKGYFESIPEDCEYVFFRKTGKGYLPLKDLRANGESSLCQALKSASISDFRFHDFRHTAATNLRRNGVRIELIMAIGGWVTLPMFLRYSNYTDDELKEVYGKNLTTFLPQSNLSNSISVEAIGN